MKKHAHCLGIVLALSSQVGASPIDKYPEYFLGKQGWIVSKLDYTDIMRFRDVKSSWPQIHFNTLKNMISALKSKGIEVFVVVVPQRLNVYPQMLPDDLKQEFTSSGTSYQNILPEVKSRGIHTVDILKAIQSSPHYADSTATYYRFEAHWNAYGSAAAAAVTAQQIKATFGKLKFPKTDFKLSVAKPVNRKDTFWLDKLSKAEQAKKPVDYEVPFKLTPAQASGDLLGNRTPAITIVGTSFTAYGFKQALMANLKTDMLDVSLGGKGMWTPMAQYLKSSNFKAHPPKLIIWEMPEYILANYPMPTKEEYQVFKSTLGVNPEPEQ
jgi:SGNH hydrolase-like domain, acetyltransferase AlgX